MASQAPRRPNAPFRFRRRLLQGVSTIACATALGTGVSWAQLAALRNAAHATGGATGAPSVAVPSVPGLSTAGSSSTGASVNRALRNAALAQKAINLAQQAQAAAQQAAASVPNGLGVGGLMPVANGVAAANDLVGVNTWQGASAPTQHTDGNGRIIVDVQQTAQRAVLDWQTFNVGANTTLNFDQSQNGVAKPDWIALNRVVGQLDPATGLRNPNLAPAPSQIFGAIKAQGTVLVINQNGILFGPGAQVNTNALIASSLEIGKMLSDNGTSFMGVPIRNDGFFPPADLAERDNRFLTQGLLADSTVLSAQVAGAFTPPSGGSDLPGVTKSIDPLLEGSVTVAAGAQITSGQGGFIVLAAPQVSNSGVLTSNQGEVALVSGRQVGLKPSNGTANNGNSPNIRGLAIIQLDLPPGISARAIQDSVENTAAGLIQAPEGYAALIASNMGTATNAGAITATTSVSRNGFVQIGGGTITLAPSSVISIGPQDGATIPQDPNSLADFKPSQVAIGATFSVDGTLQPGADINIGANSLIYAPGGDIYIGSGPGQAVQNTQTFPESHVFVDSGAVIDAAGLKDVQVSGAVHQVTIKPVTANDTADTHSQSDVLDHETVTVDPRLSGVRSDGVAWIGSPLIPAGAYAQQVGVSASQLMTKGGNVVIGAGPSDQVSNVIIKPGAVIDISGGWVTYQAGWVQTSRLVTASGAVVDIGSADPNDSYLGVYDGYAWNQPRYGISRFYANPLLAGGHYEQAYSEGGDAGSLTIRSAQASLQGTVYGEAYTGPRQALQAQVGAAASTVYGDQRHLQAVGSQLPMGGFLNILEISLTGTPAGGDVEIIDGETPTSTEDLTYGQSVAPAERGKLVLSAPALNEMGLGQFSVLTSGSLTVDAGASVNLAPGGVFSAVTGRTITVNGAISAPSGAISLVTVTGDGSIFKPIPAIKGDYDVVVAGQLSAAGLWTNDFNAAGGVFRGGAYTDGGSVAIGVAARVTDSDPVVTAANTASGNASKTADDISGSILVNGPASLIDVSAGGYVTPNGTLDLTAKGGDVTLTDQAYYFPFSLVGKAASGDPALQSGGAPGFRVNGIHTAGDSIDQLAVNPSAITAQVAIGDGAVRGYGFAGGGTFDLATPSIGLADGIADSGTNLPLDFFSKAGFGAYNITSYGTELVPNAFTNGYGGYNAVLKTQVVTVQNGQTLDLTQSGYTTHLTSGQIAGLRSLTSGGQVSSLLAPTIEADAFDRRPVNLSFGGLVEFEVAQGGRVTGAAGAGLSAGQINNLGTIRLPGGTLDESLVLPGGYAGRDAFGLSTVVTARSLSDIFSVNGSGGIDEGARSRIDPSKTNAEVAASDYIYLTGDLPADIGMSLAPGSVTDLSGEAQVNPFAAGLTQEGRQVVAGRVVGGGVLQTAVGTANLSTAPLFPVSPFEVNVAFTTSNPASLQAGLSLTAEPGATIDLSGASGMFDQLVPGGRYVSTPQWSSGGSLVLGSGGTLTGAIIDAHGGAPEASGGALTTRNLTLAAADPAKPVANTLSASQIEDAGFDVLTVQGDLSSDGPSVDLSLGQAFILTGAPVQTVLDSIVNGTADRTNDQTLYPTVSVSGDLRVSAPYIGLTGAFQVLPRTTYAANPATAATGRVTFNAQALDVTGAVLFDQSVAKVALNALSDLRLTGVAPRPVASASIPPSLLGQLVVNGDLTLSAGQVYATTGSSFDVVSTAAQGVITVSASSGSAPPTPYSAGSNLLLQAANIVQDGVLRAPVGSLTLGANAPLVINGVTFAPATQSVQLGAGSITSVSAGGLSIPYGTTTDQKEYFFSPTEANPLTGPPAAILSIGGKSVSTAPGATVDLSGGGDLFAYEFIPGTGGSRDVLSQFNSDSFSGNNGYQFPDHRQVYAIVPGLSDAPTAAYDPIYSANYGPLYGASAVGQRVHLDGGPGVPAGWYTLLPAQYAVLPGAMEVVQDTGAQVVMAGSSLALKDGTVVVSGQFGGLGGSVQSPVRLFDVKSRAVIDGLSHIVLTSANTAFAADAAANGRTAPRLPVDAGRLVLNPTASLDLDGTFLTAPGAGGRGAQVDMTAASIAVVSAPGTATLGVIQASADQLSNLKADSLLIGGVRTDNADGTTTLNITAHQITVANDVAHPLAGPDIVLAAEGAGGGITLADGAAITASGADSGGQTGDYVINGSAAGETGRGAVVRVSQGAQRVVTRNNQQNVVSGGLTVGAATLSGASVLLDSTDSFFLSSAARIAAANLALSANRISFAPTSGGAGLVITPSLAAQLASANVLTLRSSNPIQVADGGYAFGALNLDAPGLLLSDGAGQASISAGAVQLGSSVADTGACTVSGACGSGALALNVQSLTFGDGAFRIYGADAGVQITAPGGVFVQGQGSFDVGQAPLSIATSFLGDSVAQAKPGVPTEIPSLSITSGGAIVLTNPGGVAAPGVAGVPGASLALSGSSLSVSGVDVRATAGSLTLTATNGIAVGAGAILETPGYVRSFGDAADPYTVAAPGGLLTLEASGGDIALAPGSTLSVAGGAGAAGALTLNASQGAVSFGGAIDGGAPGGGAGFTLNERGAFDLSSFVAATRGAFSGDISIETGAGNLALAAGQAIQAANVVLTADGGLVEVAGTIDVSGVNGGQVGLFGTGGVTLESSAVIAARASGYGRNDTRQASAGLVELGTSGSGALTVAPGAVIDVSAAQTSPRIVEGQQDALITYNYVPADKGGTVVLRAPVSGPDGAESVNVAFGGSVKGADSVVLEGYRAYDLGAIATGGQFSGVHLSDGAAILSTTDAQGNLPNFLADVAPGTLPTFIQTFDVSASYGALGGLASQANFHARPGVELDYAGDITLASNWNLGAGVVDVAGAVAAGLMVADPSIQGAFAVKPGAEGALLTAFTRMTYRVGGSVLGEPGTLTIHAGGQLAIGSPGSTSYGSITDGFFTFADQTDPRYINTAIGGGSRLYNGVLTANANGNAVSILFPGAAGLGSSLVDVTNMAPYNPDANSPGALGADPIGSAQIFPLVQGAAGLQPVGSWSYQLTGGGASDSANPLAVQAGGSAGVTVQGTHTYSYGGVRPTASLSDTLLFNVGGGRPPVTADQWLHDYLDVNPQLNPNSPTTINLAGAPAASGLKAMAASFFAAGELTGPSNAPTGVSTTLTRAADFLTQVAAQWSTVKAGYRAPNQSLLPASKAVVSNLIRSGVGSIRLAAAGTIDLRNLDDGAPTYVDPTTGAPSNAASGVQRGGAAIYTAGAPVVPGLVTAVDEANGGLVTLDPRNFTTVEANINTVSYGYGAGTGGAEMTGLSGILLANPIYADGGGDISLSAGRDVLGLRDALTESRLRDFEAGGPSALHGTNFIGAFDQSWRTGSMGPTTIGAPNILVNPQLFTEGLGALGGGDIAVKAGGRVSDLTIAADTSLVTGTATGAVAAGQVSQGLITFGGGNVTVVAGGDLLGSRIDVSSGVAQIDAGGSIRSAGPVRTGFQILAPVGSFDNTLRLRLTDATVNLEARGDVVIQGVAALGVLSPLPANTTLDPNVRAYTFYSPNAGVSITADGSVSLQNSGDALVKNALDGSFNTVVLPGSLTAVGLEGNLALNVNPQVFTLLLTPSPTGTLTLAAGVDIEQAAVGMLDSQPGAIMPFPAVLPNTPMSTLEDQHDPRIPHRDDPVPNRIYAGEDIDSLILSVPKQTRIGAGRDIVDMMFFGQNVNPGDVTRITAGRDITATTLLQNAATFNDKGILTLSANRLPVVQGNTFVLGGPGSLMVEAGRNMGPFLPSVDISDAANSTATQSYGGGILTVGNAWNPFLPQQGASILAAFGVSKGADFDALADHYLDPVNLANLPDYLFDGAFNGNNVFTPDKSRPIYGPKLIAYMQANQAAALTAAYGTTAVSYDQAWAAFKGLPELEQRPFLLQLYFNELSLTATPGLTFNQYQRGYQAVNLLFPSSLGYTANALTGGTNGANLLQHSGDLDLRLATIQTQYGGDVDILGPGGRVLAGSTVATAQQAARRYSDAQLMYGANLSVQGGLIAGGAARGAAAVSPILGIPAGYEGVLTLRGGGISTFTDGDFVLNQSRLFTEQGGDVIMWSSNGDLNAGEGPKTSSNFPPVAVRISSDAYIQLDQTTGVTGAGIAAFKPAANLPAPNVYLIAPRGTVDAGAAGVRVAGNLFVAAARVANADNFQVAGTAIGLPPASSTVQVGTQNAAASASAVQAAMSAVANAAAAPQPRAVITVEVLGFGDEGR